jgi:DNA-binding NarL/FixJ family response regulator
VKGLVSFKKEKRMSTPTRVLLLNDDAHQAEQVLAHLQTLSTIIVVPPPSSFTELNHQANVKAMNEVDVILIRLNLVALLRSVMTQISLPQWMVLTTAQDSATAIAQTICDGANGEIPWDATPDVYADSIALIAQRCPCLSSEVAQSLLEYVTHHDIPLAPAQRTVLSAWAQRRAIPDVIELLRLQSSNPPIVTARTVYGHLDSILRSIHQAAGGK